MSKNQTYNSLVSRDGSDLLVEVEGRIDANNATEFERILSNSDEDVVRIIFDLKNLRYISSAGLRVFLQFYKVIKLRGGDLILKNTNGQIYSIFETTGMIELLSIE